MRLNYFPKLIAKRFIPLLAVLYFLQISCNKTVEVKNNKSISFIDIAKDWYLSQLNTPSSIWNNDSIKNKGISVISRMKEIEKRLDWSHVGLYKRDNMQFLIVKIDESSDHFQNKKYRGARGVIFYSDYSNNVKMEIVEILNKNENSIQGNLNEIFATCFQNEHFKTVGNVGQITANIFFYNESYNYISSFRVTNGIWDKSKNKLSIRKGGTLKNRIISTTNKRITCNCTTWYTVLFWYDMDTGEILDYDIIDQWEECGEGGEELPYGGGKDDTENPVDTQCFNDFLITKDQLINGGQVVSEGMGFNIGTIDALKKYKNPKWKILKNLTWDLYSQETGIVKLVDPGTNKWQWESLTHGSITLEGTVIGGSVSFNSGVATPSFVAGTSNVLYAGMTLDFSVTYTPLCNCGIDKIIGIQTKSYTSNSGLWPATP